MLKKAVFILSIVVLLMYPSIAIAQGPNVCGFYGNASIEGVAVPDGTTVKAWIDGKEVESVSTKQSTEGNTSYNYRINISGEYEGKTIVFTVGSLDFQAGTALWTSGGRDRLNLDGMESQSQQNLPTNPSIKLIPENGVVTRIEGEGYTPGSDLNVTVGGLQAGTTQVDLDSTFAIVIVAPNQQAGTYDVIVTDAGGRTDQATLTVPDLQGPAGADGAPGADGMPGEKGDTGGTTLAVVALILSGIAIVASVLVIIRFADFLKKTKA